MTPTQLHADYLVIGSGAMGMAFTDTLVTETDATVVLVDRHHQPGGHWNDAYPYVRLHQPSSAYGVNSRKLGSDTIDQTGWNAGLYELATNSEVCAYFDQVMQQQLRPSGRVQYFPMCNYQGDGHFQSLVSGAHYQVDAARRTVDATYMNVTVPSVRAPTYSVAEGATCVPPNALPRIAAQHDAFVVIGAGKTGMDACLWLLACGADPDRIRWIMPRDSWILDRALLQPGAVFAERILAVQVAQAEACAAAESVEDLFARLEAGGFLMRLDPNVRPTMYRCATVTQAELTQLRRITNVVRLGRVQRLEADRIVLDDGSLPTTPNTLHIDCSADGLERRPPRPVFAGNSITLQSVRTCQQVFSGAFIGHVEAAYGDDGLKNELCTPVPHPDTDIDFLRTTVGNGANQARWEQDEALRGWLSGARLNMFAQMGDPGNAGGSIDRPTWMKLLRRLQQVSTRAAERLPQLLAEADAQTR